jgi:hypothetical protein
MDPAYRAATLFRARGSLINSFPNVKDWKTIYWESQTTNGLFINIGVNPWTKTIFHEGATKQPFR